MLLTLSSGVTGYTTIHAGSAGQALASGSCASWLRRRRVAAQRAQLLVSGEHRRRRQLRRTSPRAANSR